MHTCDLKTADGLKTSKADGFPAQRGRFARVLETTKVAQPKRAEVRG